MSTITTRRRHAARVAAIATIAAVTFGAAACGSETASDNGEPAAPAAPAPQAEVVPYTPMSADAAERWGASERRAAQQVQEQYLRHLDSAAQKHDQLKVRRAWREIPIT